MNFNEPNPLALSHLGHAARMGDTVNVSKLLKQNRRIDIADNRGWNAIHEAAYGGHVDCLKLLLEKGQKYVNNKNMEGETPLSLACSNQNNPAILQLLLDNGANVNLGDNEQFTPLHNACSNGKHELGELLISAGADLNWPNFNCWTPLHCAIDSNHADLVKLLVKKGADLSRRDECGRTPLFLATQSGNWHLVDPILDKDQSVDARSFDGATALMLASQNGSLKLVEELLKKGANPNLLATDNTMAIHLSVHNGHLSIVNLLLRETSKDALLLSARARADGLACLAIDCESIEVLKALLSSDLGEEILHLPVYRYFTNFDPGEDCYEEANPISFLFYREFDEPNNTIIFLDLLLKHNFPVNAAYGNTLPPLESLILCNLPDDVKERCLDLLLSHPIDLDRSTRIFGVPDALYLACFKSNIHLMLKLLRVGISGMTEDLLQPLQEKYFSVPIEFCQNFCRIEMFKFLQRLGTSKSTTISISAWMNRMIRMSSIPSVSEDHCQISSLQQLTRIAVRKHLNKPFRESLSKLQLPVILQEYIIYHVL